MRTPARTYTAEGPARAGGEGAGEGRGGGQGRAMADSDDACVLYNEEGGIATLTLNRPKVKNAFSSDVYLRIVELLKRAADRESVLAVIITGTGSYFTSGADLKELKGKAVSTTPMLQQPFGVFATALLRFPKLVIAAVNGPAVGVGVTLLPQCDVVYALSGNPRTTDVSAGDEERRRGLRTEGGGARVEAASFWTPFFRLAIVPEFCSSVTFPKIMGWSLANEMLIMGRKLSAKEALSAGLVSTLITAHSHEAFLQQVKDDVRRTVVDTAMAMESAKTFKRVMWCNRRPRLLRVLAEELVELDRRMQAGHSQVALQHLARRPRAGSSKL
eukprot:jgi/Undpi1/12610/HiC_scaffold_6.g02279.m1